jgi:DNA-binding response OmpR family regulator
MTQIRVAVMNTSKEVTDMILEVLKIEGFSTCFVFTHQLKKDEGYFDEYLENNTPQVIIYDIAIPYEENYVLFKRLRSRKSAKGIPFVLTTINKKALEKLVGKTPAFEIIGKPFDLEELIKAVRSASRSHKTK